MKNSKVAVIKGKNPAQMTKSALEFIGAQDILKDKKVFIKLNFGGPSAKKGPIVSEVVTKAVLEFIKPICKELKVGEQGRATKEESEALFKRIWCRKLEKELGVEFVNLWGDEYIAVDVPHSLSKKKWLIPKTILNSDIVISLACLKVSAAAEVTLSLKNFFGVIPYKNKAFLHGKIHEVIVDLNQIIKPSIGIIDGIYGWEGGESSLGGNPIGMDLILASRDLVALDTVATEIMGIDSKSISHLEMADELGLGTSDLDKIDIIGENIESVKKVFKKVPFFQVWGSKISAIAGLANYYFIWKGEE